MERAVLVRNLRAAIRRRRWDDAGALLERLEAIDPLSVETRGLRLEVLVERGDLAAASALADALLAAFPASSRVHWLAGRTWYARREYARALARFEESHALHAAHLARAWIGKAKRELGQLAEAEAILVELASRHAEYTPELAYLYERMGDSERATAAWERARALGYAERAAEAAQKRITAKALPPAELIEEVEGLVALGEEVPPELEPIYLRALIDEGKMARAREHARARIALAEKGALARKVVERMGWEAHHAKAPDLVFELFAAALPEHAGNVKLLNALEKAARLTDRTADLAEIYARHAPAAPNLFGRRKRLLPRE